MTADRSPVVKLESASLRYGSRSLWRDLDVEIQAGQFVAVLGPNGVGKTSLLRVLLGQVRLSAGRASVLGLDPEDANLRVGYVPQHRAFDRSLPLRGRDLVRLGVDGHRWGLPLPSPARRELVESAIAAVGATTYAGAPIGLLSGGEQQRLRIAQALASDPALLLCDEPLLSLDLGSQRLVVELLDARRRTHDTAVLFVTHDVNPILPAVDSVLYLAPGSWAIGSPDEVLTDETLTRLYGTRVDVLRVQGRVIVVGTPDEPGAVLGEAAYAHAHLEGHDHGHEHDRTYEEDE